MERDEDTVCLSVCNNGKAAEKRECLLVEADSPRARKQGCLPCSAELMSGQ